MKQKSIFLFFLIFIGLSKIVAQIPTLAWAKKMGGAGEDRGHCVAIDASGNIYTTGFFSFTSDFNPSAVTNNIVSFGSNDVFVSKLDANGNFVWAKRLGGTGDDRGNSITIDLTGNIYITGSFIGTADFDPGAGTYTLVSTPGVSNSFTCKLDAAGNFVWAKQITGNSNNEALSIITDASGNVYTSGYFHVVADFDPGPGTYTLDAWSGNDVFISKLDATGNFVWAKQLGSTSPDDARALSITLDNTGNVYTTGYFSSTIDFDPGPGIFNLTCVGISDVFVSKLDAAGNFVWAKQIGGVDYDSGYSITIDVNGNSVITGYFSSTADFDPGPATFTLTSTGYKDAFVTKLDASGNFLWARQLGGSGTDIGYSATTDTVGNIYTVGSFSSTADLDPGVATLNFYSYGASDIFINKLDMNGNFIWAQQMGGGDIDEGVSIKLDANENIYTTGYFALTADFDPGPSILNIASNGVWDIFVHKLGQGNITNVPKYKIDAGINSYPNPFNDKITIIKGSTDQNILIFDIMGTLIYEGKIKEGKIELNLSTIPNGIYFLKVDEITKKIIKN